MSVELNPKLTYGFIDLRGKLAGDSYNWSWIRKTTDIKYLVIHHSAGATTQTPQDIASFHVNTRGWGGIGYHFVIDVNGLVSYVGDLSTARANVKDKNEQVIGVCLIGDFTKELPSDRQIIAAHELSKFILFDLSGNFPNLKGWKSLVGHQDLQSTACPGDTWKGVSGMRDRIINNIPYFSAPPETIPEIPDNSNCDKYVQKIAELEKSLQETKQAFDNVNKILTSIKSLIDGR